MVTGDAEKVRTLRANGSWNGRWEQVQAPRFASEEGFFDARDLVQVKYEMLRCVREDGVSVAEAARLFGFSRMRFYQIQHDFEAEGVAGLMPREKGPRGAHKLTSEVMRLIEAERARNRGVSSADLAAVLEDRMGLQVHPRSIERALARRQKKRR